eukprot:m.156914 g.156914  ORF g.156914 m.156914 type:complete len:111 (-) comp23642_c1_seq2:2959-3291(-)
MWCWAIVLAVYIQPPFFCTLPSDPDVASGTNGHCFRRRISNFNFNFPRRRTRFSLRQRTPALAARDHVYYEIILSFWRVIGGEAKVVSHGLVNVRRPLLRQDDPQGVRRL